MIHRQRIIVYVFSQWSSYYCWGRVVNPLNEDCSLPHSITSFDLSRPPSVTLANSNNSTYRKILAPYRWTYCASYNLQAHAEGLIKVGVESPMDVWVIIHNRDQITIPKELAAYIRFDAYHVVEVTVEKTVDLDQKQKPCYDPAQHNNVTYGDHNYEILAKILIEKFNCTTPFIPAQFRNGSKLCETRTMLSKVHWFMMYSSSSFATNLWSSTYYTHPPCIYQSYMAQETISGKGKFKNSWLPSSSIHQIHLAS